MVTLYRARFYPATATYTIETVTAAGINPTSVWMKLANNRLRYVRRLKKYEGFFLHEEEAFTFVEQCIVGEFEALRIQRETIARREQVLETAYAQFRKRLAL